jgi:hypothetical protein
MRHLEAARGPPFAPRKPTRHELRQRSDSTGVARPAPFYGQCVPRAPYLSNRAVPELQRSGRPLHGAKHSGAPPVCCAGGLPKRVDLPGPMPSSGRWARLDETGPCVLLVMHPGPTLHLQPPMAGGPSHSSDAEGEWRRARSVRELVGSTADRRAPRQRRVSGLEPGGPA